MEGSETCPPSPRSARRPATRSPTMRARRSGCSGCCRRSRSAATTPIGRYGLVEIVVPEGIGSPWHVHPEEDEWFYVLEGAMTFWVADTRLSLTAGIVRVRPQGRAAHLLRRRRRSEGAGRVRADAVRGIPARGRRARSRARAAAAARRPARHGAADPDREAKRLRDPRPPRPPARPLTHTTKGCARCLSRVGRTLSRYPGAARRGRPHPGRRNHDRRHDHPHRQWPLHGRRPRQDRRRRRSRVQPLRTDDDLPLPLRRVRDKAVLRWHARDDELRGRGPDGSPTPISSSAVAS